MVDFKGKRLPPAEEHAELQLMIADLRRKSTECLLDLMESQLNRGETVATVFARARGAVKLMHDFETGSMRPPEIK